MICCDDYQRVLILARLFQIGDHPPDMMVYFARKPKIYSAQSLHRIFVGFQIGHARYEMRRGCAVKHWGEKRMHGFF